MRTAIFSDIHANLEALEAALEHAAGQRIGRFAVLGDVVGYGANPNECCAWAIAHAAFWLRGNHEQAVWDKSLRRLFNPMAAEAIVWTEKILESDYMQSLKELGFVRTEGDLTFAHGSPDKPEDFRYLLSFEDARSSFQATKARRCFVGHTHLPCCFSESSEERFPLKPGVLQLSAGERYILNPGAVGQPRDGDTRLSYGIYDSGADTFEVVRIPYDNEKAARKIRKAGLPAYLATRLL